MGFLGASMAMCALPGVNDVPIFATVVHLVLSEWLPIWLFYFANYTLMTETTSYLYLWYTDVELSDLSDWMATLSSKDAKRVENLGEYVFCVQNEMNIASWSFDLSYKGNCVSLRGGYNLLAVANYISLLLCCGVVVPSLCLILWNDGSDICTGKYLATKWRYEKTRLFHCLAVMLLVLVVAGFLVTAIVSGATLKSQTHLGTGVAKSVPNFAFSWFNIRFGLLSPFTFLVQWESLPLDLKDPQGVIRQILHFWNGAVKIKCETCWTFEKVMPSWLRNLPAEDIRSIDINVCCICAGY